MKKLVILAVMTLGVQAMAQSSTRNEQISDIVKSTPDSVFASASAKKEAKETLSNVISRQLDICLVGKDLEKVRSAAGEQAAQDYGCDSVIKSAGSTLTKDEVQSIVDAKVKKDEAKKPVTRTYLK